MKFLWFVLIGLLVALLTLSFTGEYKGALVAVGVSVVVLSFAPIPRHWRRGNQGVAEPEFRVRVR